jgi:hypothetical protein
MLIKLERAYPISGFENLTGLCALYRRSSEVCTKLGTNELSALIIVWGATEADGSAVV